jgi:hypothetical protein
MRLPNPALESAELIEWARSYLLRPEFEMASPADFDIPHCVTNANEAPD